MKTLFVNYLPSGDDSSTKLLFDKFYSSLNDEKEIIDLVLNPPTFFNHETMSLYKKRNYGGSELSDIETATMKSIDDNLEKFINADVIVMSFPMHNFSVPAAIKAFIDNVVQKGKTFDYGKKMMAGKKVVAMYSSGGIYEGKMEGMDALSPVIKINFKFMGFDEIEIIPIWGVNSDRKEEFKNKAFDRISNIISNWYK